MGASVEAVPQEGADFSIWHKDPKYREAFLKIRQALAQGAVLVHIDYEAAASPEKPGRALEIFIDASDFAWAATLTQRLVPHGAPKVVAISARGFTDVQQRWSAMERELFAVWQGVLSHERFIKGFKIFLLH